MYDLARGEDDDGSLPEKRGGTPGRRQPRLPRGEHAEHLLRGWGGGSSAHRCCAFCPHGALPVEGLVTISPKPSP